MIAPCKDCERRFIGCHSQCEEYQQFREWRDVVNEIKYHSKYDTYEMSRYLFANIRRKEKGQ